MAKPTPFFQKTLIKYWPWEFATIGGEKGKLGISRLSFVKKFEVYHNHLSLPQLDGDKKRDMSHNKKPGTCRRFSLTFTNFKIIFDAMANHGHCRSCYWWQMIEYYNNPNILNVGLCWMQSDSKHKVFHKTKEDSYCPDYSKAKKANGLTYRYK